MSREGKGSPEGTQPIVNDPGPEAGLPSLALGTSVSYHHQQFPSKSDSQSLDGGQGSCIQNIESFPNVNILVLTNLFENTFFQNNLFLNS